MWSEATYDKHKNKLSVLKPLRLPCYPSNRKVTILTQYRSDKWKLENDIFGLQTILHTGTFRRRKIIELSDAFAFASYLGHLKSSEGISE